MRLRVIAKSITSNQLRLIFKYLLLSFYSGSKLFGGNERPVRICFFYASSEPRLSLTPFPRTPQPPDTSDTFQRTREPCSRPSRSRNGSREGRNAGFDACDLCATCPHSPPWRMIIIQDVDYDVWAEKNLVIVGILYLLTGCMVV